MKYKLIFIAVFCLQMMHAQENVLKHYNVLVLNKSEIRIIGHSSWGEFKLLYRKNTAPLPTIAVSSDSENQSVYNANLNLDADYFNSGFFLVNKYFKKLLKVSTYPEIEVALMRFTKNYATLALSIAGVKKEVEFKYTATPIQNYYRVTSTQEIALTDFNLDWNSVNSFIEIDNNCAIVLDMYVSIEDQESLASSIP